MVFPRVIGIARAHNDYYDDQYHLVRGQRFLAGQMVSHPLEMNDPPLGEALIALPLRWSGDRAIAGNVIYEQRAISPEKLLLRIALWKGFLFLPMCAIAFIWARQLYGLKSAWLSMMLLVFEPTFAAHISVAALDVLGTEAIFIASFFAWHYTQQRTWPRLILMCVVVAGAMLVKNTAIILPIVPVIFLAIDWWRHRRDGRQFFCKKLVLQIIVAVIFTPLCIWAWLGFQISRPTFPPAWILQPQAYSSMQWIDRPLPGGIYVTAIIGALDHGQRGHWGFLLGETRTFGWWYYFAVVALYKVPIGYAIVALLAIFSLWIIRPRFDELSLLIPALLWIIFLSASGINIGWRHFLPAYGFLIPLASRAAMTSLRWFTACAFAGFAIGAGHGLLWLPNDLSYINFPRRRAFEAINDSNLDWGQGIKQTRDWILAHPSLTHGHNQLYVRPFCRAESPALALYLEHLHNVHVLQRDDPVPKNGTLIISVVWLVNVYHEDRFVSLAHFKPMATIGGGALKVFNLDSVPHWREQTAKINRRPTTTAPIELPMR